MGHLYTDTYPYKLSENSLIYIYLKIFLLIYRQHLVRKKCYTVSLGPRRIRNYALASSMFVVDAAGELIKLPIRREPSHQTPASLL